MCENENMGESGIRDRALVLVCICKDAPMCSLLVEKEAQGVGKSVVLVLDSKGHAVVVRDIEHGLVSHIDCLLGRGCVVLMEESLRRNSFALGFF